MNITPESLLTQLYGHAEFRGRQREIIDHVLAGKHSLVIMPTGMGKSICFQIPALLMAKRFRTDLKAGEPQPITLVLSPLIALMKDQVDALKNKGIDAEFINSSLSREDREARYRGLADGKFDLLYVTPERFRKPEFREPLSQRKVTLLAVDEAHCVSEWGHDFRPDYTRLDDIRRELGRPTTIALTATATPHVQQDIVRQLGFETEQVQLFHQGIDRPNLSLEVGKVWGDEEKLERILEVVQQVGGSGIVYFTLIRTLMAYHEKLREKNLPHSVYHGELERYARRSIQERFMERPDQLVLATNAFGMGVDKADIRFVIHADLPGSLESYYQEIGRAGRDGLASRCLLLYDEHDLATQMEFVRWSNPDSEFYQRVYEFLDRDAESINAFGLEWLREKLHAKQKHDRRLESALAMLERHDAFSGTLEPLQIDSVGELPDRFLDEDMLSEKLKRDQMKLYSLVQYANHTGDRVAMLHEYFGISAGI